MCRLLAISGKTTKKEALSILDNFLGANTDGVGYVYASENKFVVKKYPYSLEKVLKNKNKNKDFLSHLPYDGITLIHLRSSSVGENKKCNTHPFIIGEGKGQFALIHNGTFHAHDVARLAMCKTVNFEGQCDSEVAGHLINIAGVKAFTNNIDFAGVFMVLNLKGELTVIKTSGELSMVNRKGGRMLLASELDFKEYPKQLEALLGYYHFDNRLRYINHREKKSQFQWSGTSYNNSFGGSKKTTPYDDDEDNSSAVAVTTRVFDPVSKSYIKKTMPLNTFKQMQGIGGGQLDFYSGRHSMD